jgi:urease accessory protein
MLHVRELAATGSASQRIALPYESRSRSRLRTVLPDGREIGIVLPRGTVLRDGTLLRATDGSLIEVRAVPEEVSTVHADGLLLARVAYHLGNRHVAVQVGPGFLRYLRDGVLDEMVRRLGASPIPEVAPFEPETGAYDTHGGAA